MFAPAHHRATRFVVPVRHELGVRTIFNMLGPLTNPAGASRQLIGVSDAGFLETIAGALALLGSRRALVVRGEDGLDEVSSSAPTTVVELDGSDIRRYTIAPEEFGIEPVQLRRTAWRPTASRPPASRAPLAFRDCGCLHWTPLAGGRHSRGERGGHARDPRWRIRATHRSRADQRRRRDLRGRRGRFDRRGRRGGSRGARRRQRRSRAAELCGGHPQVCARRGGAR